MGIDFIRHLARRTILHLPKRSPSPNYIQCHFMRHQFTKTRGWETPPAKHLPFRYNLCSKFSSSSSNRRMGLLTWYLGILESRPVLTKSVSACLIYAAADYTSQMITMPPSGSFDSIRTLRMAGYGLLFLGPGQHLWFNFMARILPKRDIVTTLKKLGMGQLIFGPIITGIFFSYNAVLQGESGNEIAARLKRDLIPTLKTGVLFWPMCDFFTYKIIPVHLQPLMNSSFSYVWTIYLTYMASLKKPVAD